MSPYIIGLAIIVAAEHLYIMYLETFATTSERTAGVFGMEVSELKRPAVFTLFKNQGIYNGLLAALILLAAFVFPSQTALSCLFAYIVLVAIYGAYSSSPKIVLMQGGPAILGFIATLLLR